MKVFLAYVDQIKIPPEVYGLVCFAVVILYMRKQIRENEDLGKRWHRFLATIISKKYFAWAVVTVMFWYDHFVWQYMGLRFMEYLLFTCATFSIDVWQKHIGLEGKK